MDQKEFINRSLHKGLATFEQVQACLKEQEEQKTKTGTDIPIWELMVQKSILTVDQAEALKKGEEAPKTFRFGDYAIEAKIGEGGMGMVYRAKKEGEDRTVALKVLPQRFSTDDDYVKRFRREAVILTRLSHPNLVKAYEFGEVGGRWFYAMEYVSGKVIGQLIKEKKRFPVPEALPIVIQLAGALRKMHSKNLVHRDIKPDNIIVNEDGTAKLMDLGLAKSVLKDYTRLTQTGMAVGTPHYMSPEQIQGSEDLDIRTDIYSLGATLYHMVTGAQPFSGNVMMEIIQKQLKHELDDPRAHNPELPDGICHLLEKMMAREPRDRYASPDELLGDLELLLDGKQPRTARLDVGRSMVKRRVKAGTGSQPLELRPSRRQSRRTRIAPPPPPPAAKASSTLMMAGLGLGILFVAGGLYLVLAGKVEKPKPRPQARRPVMPKPQPAVRPPQPAPVPPPKLAPPPPPPPSREKQREEEARRLFEKAKHFALQNPDRHEKIIGLYTEAQWAAAGTGLFEEIQREAQERRDRYERSLATAKKEVSQRVQILSTNGKYEELLPYLKEQRSRYETAEWTQAIDKAIGDVESILSEVPPDPGPSPGPNPPDTAALWKEADEHFEAGRLNQAILSLTEIIRASPRNSRAYGLRARAFLLKEDLKSAENDVQQGLRWNPGEPLSQYVLARILLARDQPAPAIEAFTRAIAGNPSWHEAYFGRAEGFLMLGRWTDASRDLSEAGQLNKAYYNEPGFLQMKADAYIASDQLDDALETCEAWIDLDPKSVDAYLARADIYMMQEKYKDARSDYSRVLRMDPKNEFARAGKEEAADLASGRRGGKMTSAGARKILGKYFNAAKERFKVLQDGQLQVTLTYDFTDPDQLKDFMTLAAVQEGKRLRINGSANGGGALLFRPELKGDFAIQAEITLDRPMQPRARGIYLRTTDSADPTRGGGGIGVALGNPGQMSIQIFENATTLTPLQAIPYRGSASVIPMLLRRAGTRVTGDAGAEDLHATVGGHERVRLALHSFQPIRVQRLELQGILDPDWAEAAFKKPRRKRMPRRRVVQDPGLLWNGSNLQEWDFAGAAPTPDNGSIVWTSRPPSTLLHKRTVQTDGITLETSFTIERAFDLNSAGVMFALMFSGNPSGADGDLRVGLGPRGFRMGMVSGGRWVYSDYPLDRGLAEGQSYRLILRIQGRRFTIILDGIGEVDVPNFVPPGPTARPGIFIQSAQARITSYTLR